MRHTYPLHADLTVACLCCGAEHHFRFTSASDHVVCTACQHHLGEAKAERRDQEHIQMWSGRYVALRVLDGKRESEAATANSAATAVITDLRRQVEALTHAISSRFEETPANGIRSMLESDVTRRAERNVVLAEARTDRLMAVLWHLESLHRETEGADFCSCGKSLVVCTEWKAIEGQRSSIRKWEAKNIALRAAGKRHALPIAEEQHPQALRTHDRQVADHRAEASAERQKPR